MNERIKELAEQAHSYACKYAQQPDYNPHNPYNQGMYKQRYDSKFAELIVRECMKESMDEIVDDAEIAQEKDPLIREYLTGNNQGIVDAVVRFRNHFGVTE